MDFVTPLPSKVNHTFWNLYQKNPSDAINYFYQMSQDNDYIKVKAIAKNISYQVATDYGNLEITINLSKPEKDPKAIAAAGKAKQTGYPKCQLCLENEGYLGRLGYPARSNHRVIRFTLGGETWGFQYSPYAYFKEHAIFPKYSSQTNDY
jgi:Galactose-1-phosphate uridyltransferase